MCSNSDVNLIVSSCILTPRLLIYQGLRNTEWQKPYKRICIYINAAHAALGHTDLRLSHAGPYDSFYILLLFSKQRAMGSASFRVVHGRAIISSVCPSYCRHARDVTGERGQLRTWAGHPRHRCLFWYCLDCLDLSHCCVVVVFYICVLYYILHKELTTIMKAQHPSRSYLDTAKTWVRLSFQHPRSWQGFRISWTGERGRPGRPNHRWQEKRFYPRQSLDSIVCPRSKGKVSWTGL